MSNAEFTTRRKYPRRKFRRGVGFLCLGEYKVASGFEIGEGGLAFKCEEAMAIGAHVIVSFQIPEGAFISVRGEVRSKKDEGGSRYMYGVSFENLKFEWRREIRNFVTARTANEH
ncbi:MAG: PilZ domain-containing protein [Bdellovibrionaceae bacterium]|nr:PilZ domain-containing protein [Pseudobdellovibrionaceae bacterium]